MTRALPQTIIMRQVYLLIAWIVLIAVAMIGVVQVHSWERTRLNARNTEFHLEVTRYASALKEDLNYLSLVLNSRSPVPEGRHVALDRTLYAVNERVDAIVVLHQRFGYAESVNPVLRLQRAAALLADASRRADRPGPDVIEAIAARAASMHTRLDQLVRLHERASTDSRRRMYALERREIVSLALAILVSVLASLAIVTAIVKHIRRLFAQQAAGEQALQASERRARQILDSMHAFVGVFSLDGRVIETNRALLVAAELRPEDVIGRPLWEISLVAYSAETQAQVRSALARAAAGETVFQDVSLRVAGGRMIVMDSTFAPLYDVRHQVTAVIGSGVDVTARKRAEGYMRMLSTALEQTVDSVMITTTDGTIEYVNQAFTHITGYDAYEVIGRTPNLLKSGKHLAEFYRELWDTILAGNSFNQIFVNRRKDGSLYSEEKTITPLKDANGRLTHFVSAGRDISERIQTQERLHFLANHDALTGLPNRTLLLDRLEQAISRARWNKRVVATLFLDLDRFKNINDTLGHNIGDELLRVLAARLSATVRNGDTVARFGGDEFVILLDDIADASDIAIVAQKILDALAPPVELGATLLHVSASIGVSTFPSDGEDPGALLKNADTAMYRAKESGRNTYQFYSRDMSTRALERITLESHLRHALNRGEFTLHYQPQIDVLRNRVVGVEALLRWRHPDMDVVSPAQFVPILEETGLIVPVGEWVLVEACAQLARWRAAGLPYLRMAVNLSSRQFVQPNLAAVVTETLSRFGLPPTALEVELTESLLMRPTEVTQRTITALDDLGVRFGLDDFGTGFSSLSYLQRYPFDTLKVDRSFIRDLPGDAHDAALTRAILAMGHSLKLDVIAEGVETEAQREFLLAHGCVTMQGFLFARPMPAEDLGAWILGRVQGSADAKAA